jgi:hypothetical protein
VPEQDRDSKEMPPTERRALARAIGPFGRARGQSLGVLALAMSGAVVVFAIFILPHDAPAAVRPGAAQSPQASHVTGSTRAPTHDPTTTTTSPGAASLLTPSLLLPSGASGLASSGVGAAAVTKTGPTQATTTTTSAPPAPIATATTTTPTYVPPHVGSQSWPGNLGAPYTSASYQLTTTGGEVSAQATWSGTPTLTLEVTCGAATKSLSGSSGLYVAVDASAGSCSITLSEPAGVSVAVSYTLTASYPTS